MFVVFEKENNEEWMNELGTKMIRQLSDEVKSSIRTGVALTSFAQAVEELVLNSVDAGATSIAVRVDLPCFKIQVVDNGTGITPDQLPLLGERYSTSKCHTVEDLENLKYFGYRGEALASLRSASLFLEIVSKPCLSTITYCKCFRKGKPMDFGQSSIPRPSVGTTITAHDLFYNLPVRRKRLNEGLEIEKIRFRVAGIALSWPLISFSLRDDATGHVILQTRKSGDLASTFSTIFTPSRARALMEVSAARDEFRLSGLVSKESYSRADLQFVFVNKRLVLKSSIHKQINKILGRSLILKRKGSELSDRLTNTLSRSPTKLTDRFGIYIMKIECPFSAYDITFDPSKTLVEFKNWPKVIHLLQDMLYGFLRKENLLSLTDTFLPSPYQNNKEDNESDDKEEDDDEDNESEEKNKMNPANLNSLFSRVSKERQKEVEIKHASHDPRIDAEGTSSLDSESDEAYDTNHKSKTVESSAESPVSSSDVNLKKTQPKPLFLINTESSYSDEDELNLKPRKQNNGILSKKDKYKEQRKDLSNRGLQRNVKPNYHTGKELPLGKGDKEHPTISSSSSSTIRQEEDEEEVLIQPAATTIKPVTTQISVGKSVAYSSSLSSLRMSKSLSTCSRNQGSGVITNTLQQLKMLAQELRKQMGDPFQTPKPACRRKSQEEAGCCSPEKLPRMKQRGSETEKRQNQNTSSLNTSSQADCQKCTDNFKDPMVPCCVEDFNNWKALDDSVSGCVKVVKKASSCVPHKCYSTFLENTKTQSCAQHTHSSLAHCSKDVGSLCAKNLPSNHVQFELSERNEPEKAVASRTRQSLTLSDTKVGESLLLSPEKGNHSVTMRGQSVRDLTRTNEERNSPSKRRSVEAMSHSSKLAKLMRGESIRVKNATLEDDKQAYCQPQTSCLQSFRYKRHKDSPRKSKEDASNTVESACIRNYRSSICQNETSSFNGRQERPEDAANCTSCHRKKYRDLDDSSSAPGIWESCFSKASSTEKMPEFNDKELPFSIYKTQESCDYISSKASPKVSVVLSIPLEPVVRKETLPPPDQEDKHWTTQCLESRSEEGVNPGKKMCQTNIAQEGEDAIQASQGFVPPSAQLEPGPVENALASRESSGEDNPCQSERQVISLSPPTVMKQHNSQSPCLSQGFVVIDENNKTGEKAVSNSSESPLVEDRSPRLVLKNVISSEGGIQEKTVSGEILVSEKVSKQFNITSENPMSHNGSSGTSDFFNCIEPFGNRLLSEEVKISSKEEHQIMHPFSTEVVLRKDKHQEEKEPLILAFDSIRGSRNINIIPETENADDIESDLRKFNPLGEEDEINNMPSEAKCCKESQVLEDIAKLNKILDSNSTLPSCNKTHYLTLTGHLLETVGAQAVEAASIFDSSDARKGSLPCGQNTFVEMTHHNQDSNSFPFLSVLTPEDEEEPGIDPISSKQSEGSCDVEDICKACGTALSENSDNLPLLQPRNDNSVVSDMLNSDSKKEEVLSSKIQLSAANIEKQMNQQANCLPSTTAAGDSDQDQDKELWSSFRYLDGIQTRQIADKMSPSIETYSEDCSLETSQKNHSVTIPISKHEKLPASAVNCYFAPSRSRDNTSLQTADTVKIQGLGSGCQLLTMKIGKQDRSDIVLEDKGSPTQLIQNHDNVHTETVAVPVNTPSFTDNDVSIADHVSSDLTRCQKGIDLAPEDVHVFDFETEPHFIQEHCSNELKHRSTLTSDISVNSLSRVPDVYHESPELNVKDHEQDTNTAIQTSEKGKDERMDQACAEFSESHEGIATSEDCNSQGNEEVVSPWTKLVDSNTAGTVYVNSMSGHSISEDQWSAISARRCNQLLATESSGQLFATCSEPLTLVRRNQTQGTKAESTGQNELRQENSDISSKWREGKRPVYKTELGADVKSVIAKWNNPVFLKYKQPTMSARNCPSGIAAKSSFNSLAAIGITKDMLTQVEVLGQLDNKFIVCLTSSHSGAEQDDGCQLVLFDQHAVHERIRLEMLTADIYEEENGKLTNKIKRSEVIPAYSVVIDQDDVRIMSAFVKEFDRIGVSFSAEKNRRDLVKILTMPACIAERETCESKASRYARALDTTECLIKEHINLLKSTHGACGRLPLTIHKVLCSQACHGAVKFGDPLTGKECKDLLKALASCHLPFQCAHGRPSVVPLVNLSALKLDQQPVRPKLWTISKHLQN